MRFKDIVSITHTIEYRITHWYPNTGWFGLGCLFLINGILTRNNGNIFTADINMTGSTFIIALSPAGNNITTTYCHLFSGWNHHVPARCADQTGRWRVIDFVGHRGRLTWLWAYIDAFGAGRYPWFFIFHFFVSVIGLFCCINGHIVAGIDANIFTCHNLTTTHR